MQRERYRIADLTLDVEAVSLLREGQPIQLPRLSFDLLVALTRRAPDVVGFEELIETVWAGTAVSDETLTQRVALLRRALGDEAKNPRYLRAVRGRGYQLVPEVLPASPGVETPGYHEKDRPRGDDSPWRWRSTAIAAGAAVVLAALGLAVVLIVAGGRPPAAEAVATRSPRVPELLARAGTYLSLHQERNNELAIELYQRALRIEPDNPRALAGLSLALGQRATKFNQRGARDEALELAREAVRRDPQLGLAHHALGLAFDSRGQVSGALAEYLRAAELDPQLAGALASAAHLLQVQGHLAAALETDLRAAQADGNNNLLYLEVQIGVTLALLGFDQPAAVWFERALELRPDNVFAAASFARMRLSQARLQEADAIAARAIERGIRRPELPTIRGTVALLKGDEIQARAFFQEALKIAPDYPTARIRLLLLDGPRPDLQERYRELVTDARRGRTEGDEWPDSAIDEALLEASFGDEDAALRALGTAIDLGYRDAGWLLLDPMLAGLRDDPGFLRHIETIRRRVNAERQRVLDAGWLPPSFLDGSAARM